MWKPRGRTSQEEEKSRTKAIIENVPVDAKVNVTIVK